MASISDMISQNALQNATQAPDLTGDIQKGAQLAQTVQNIQTQRQQMDQARQTLELAKLQHWVSAVAVGSQIPEGPMRNQYMTRTIPTIAQTLGLTDKISPQSMEMIQKDPTVVSSLKNDVESGQAGFQEAASTLTDSEALGKYIASGKVEAYKAQSQMKPENPFSFEQDPQQTAIKTNLVAQIEGNKFNLPSLYAARRDPTRFQDIAQQLGTDPATLGNIMDNYPQALGGAEKLRVQNEAMKSRYGYQDVRNEQQLVLQTQGQISKVATGSQFDQMAEGAIRSRKLIENAMSTKDPTEKVARTKQLLVTLSQEQAKLAAGKANFGETSAEGMAIRQADSNITYLIDQLRSGVTDVSTLDGKLKNAENEINELGGSYVNAIHRQIQSGLDMSEFPKQRDLWTKAQKAIANKYGKYFDTEGNAVGGGSATINVNGKNYNRAMVQKLLKQHPDDPAAPAFRKALGGG